MSRCGRPTSPPARSGPCRRTTHVSPATTQLDAGRLTSRRPGPGGGGVTVGEEGGRREPRREGSAY
eukprot:COSAG03_NODE_653_length_6435_cov_8.434186_2_plen_66_part_00